MRCWVSAHTKLHFSKPILLNYEYECVAASKSGSQMRQTERWKKTNIEFSSFYILVLLIVNEFEFVDGCFLLACVTKHKTV